MLLKNGNLEVSVDDTSADKLSHKWFKTAGAALQEAFNNGDTRDAITDDLNKLGVNNETVAPAVTVTIMNYRM